MKNIIFHRDFLAFILLLVICKTAIDIKNPTINTDISPSASTHQALATQPVVTKEPTIVLHEPATAIAERAQAKLEPFVAQEVDQNIVKQIECAQTQIRKALDIAQPTSVEAAQLYSLLQKLSLLHTEYKANLPKESTPGPLKAAAIALEEEDIKKELLSTIHKFASILHTLAGGVHEPDNSVVKELEANHHLLDKLIHA
jgi:hypothetical protein